MTLTDIPEDWIKTMSVSELINQFDKLDDYRADKSKIKLTDDWIDKFVNTIKHPYMSGAATHLSCMALSEYDRMISDIRFESGYVEDDHQIGVFPYDKAHYVVQISNSRNQTALRLVPEGRRRGVMIDFILGARFQDRAPFGLNNIRGLTSGVSLATGHADLRALSMRHNHVSMQGFLVSGELVDPEIAQAMVSKSLH